MSLPAIVNIFLFFLISNAYSNIKEEITPPTNTKPLVLQWEVSHTRNTDQISLIFKQNHVELVTNTSSYQTGKTIRLGWFKTSMNPELELIKEQIKQYFTQLKNTIPISNLIIKDSRFQPTVDPHAPILRINEKKVHKKHPYFKPAAKIIHEAWKRKWTCVECATYKKKKKSIIRTVKKLQAESQNKQGKKEKIKWEETKQTLVKKLLNCISKEKKKEECVDPQFGIFEI